MNRNTFLKLLPFIPIGIKAVVSQPRTIKYTLKSTKPQLYKSGFVDDSVRIGIESEEPQCCVVSDYYIDFRIPKPQPRDILILQWKTKE